MAGYLDGLDTKTERSTTWECLSRFCSTLNKSPSGYRSTSAKYLSRQNADALSNENDFKGGDLTLPACPGSSCVDYECRGWAVQPLLLAPSLASRTRTWSHFITGPSRCLLAKARAAFEMLPPAISKVCELIKGFHLTTRLLCNRPSS